MCLVSQFGYFKIKLKLRSDNKLGCPAVSLANSVRQPDSSPIKLLHSQVISQSMESKRCASIFK